MKIIIRLLLILFMVISCDKTRETLGLNQYQPDEYEVTTNPPLDIPPNFNILAPSELVKEKHHNSNKVLPNSAESSILKNME